MGDREGRRIKDSKKEGRIKVRAERRNEMKRTETKETRQKL